MSEKDPSIELIELIVKVVRRDSVVFDD